MTFFFEAKTFEEKEAWIGAIGKAMVKTGNTVFMGNVWILIIKKGDKYNIYKY